MDLTQIYSKIPKDQWSQNSEDLKNYGKDWTKHFTPKPSAIVFPKSTEEVRELVLWANQNRIHLVPSGGRTGLSAGAYATNNEVVVSFEKMNKILNFNEIEKTNNLSIGGLG